MTQSFIQNRITVTAFKESGKFYTSQSIAVTNTLDHFDAFVQEVVSKIDEPCLVNPGFVTVITPWATDVKDPNDASLYTVLADEDINPYRHLIGSVPGYKLDSPVARIMPNLNEYTESQKQKAQLIAFDENGTCIHMSHFSFTGYAWNKSFVTQLYLATYPMLMTYRGDKENVRFVVRGFDSANVFVDSFWAFEVIRERYLNLKVDRPELSAEDVDKQNRLEEYTRILEAKSPF